MTTHEDIKNFLKFRKNIGVLTSKKLIVKVFGDKVFKNDTEENSFNTSETENIIAQRKIDLVREKISRFLVYDWVKYIAVTGSIAAGNVDDEDDIDIFIVVKNGTMWIYRGLMLLKLGRLLRNENNPSLQKDKFCPNLIVEERGLTFPNDMFNFHELYTMIPLYQPNYKDYIFSKNKWVEGFGGILPIETATSFKVSQYVEHDSNPFVRFANVLAMYAQYLYRRIMGHQLDEVRMKKNNVIGRIEFFHEYFREEKLEKFKKSLDQ